MIVRPADGAAARAAQAAAFPTPEEAEESVEAGPFAYAEPFNRV